MKQQLLLLQDVPKLGRKGEIVTAKPGFIRNFLLPQQKGVIATKSTLRMRAKLQQERATQADIDRKESEKLSKVIADKVLTTKVKTDPMGHLYGSVSITDILKLLAAEGIALERHHVDMTKAIKKLGEYKIALTLNEGVPASFMLKIEGDGVVLKKAVVEETPVDDAVAEEKGDVEEKSE
ncbi:MAG: 50S ribosomal protein L9 [Simkaniaceae bacterium]|nr:50S ribosomal protein L9 [Simkaniaceae bacterium]